VIATESIIFFVTSTLSVIIIFFVNLLLFHVLNKLSHHGDFEK